MRNNLLPRFVLAVSLLPSVKELDNMERFKPKKDLGLTVESSLTGISNLASGITASFVPGYELYRTSTRLQNELMIKTQDFEPMSATERRLRQFL
jgi:hypothetical protein